MRRCGIPILACLAAGLVLAACGDLRRGFEGGLLLVSEGGRVAWAWRLAAGTGARWVDASSAGAVAERNGTMPAGETTPG